MSEKKLLKDDGLGKRTAELMVSLIELENSLEKHWDIIKENKKIATFLQETIGASAEYLTEIHTTLSKKLMDSQE